MRATLAFVIIAFSGFVLAEGCSGDVMPMQNNGGLEGVAGIDYPCTDPDACCSPSELVCFGNPDFGIVCSCRKLWDCGMNLDKCSQPIRPPDDSGGWRCTEWSAESGLTCEKSGSASDVPSGAGEFNCQYDSEQNKIVCTEKTPSSPTEAAGDWSCAPTSTAGPQKLECEKKEGGSSSGGSSSGGDNVAGSGGTWECNDDVTRCEKTDNNGGLPPGGADWRCHEETLGGDQYIVCVGKSTTNPENGSTSSGSGSTSGGSDSNSSNGSSDSNTSNTGSGSSSGGSSDSNSSNTGSSSTSGGSDSNTSNSGSGDSSSGGGTNLPTPDEVGGWNCAPVPNSDDEWVCKRPKTTADVPSGGGDWSCVISSEFGGIVCEKVDAPPTPPGPYPKPGDTCVAGTMRWCDGLQFCGWGQITCKPDGTWPTKVVNGKQMLDCQERSDGRRPDTLCGCYHFYFNPKCCERPDCIVPEGTDGRTCARSNGKLCDYCNPQNPECNTGICAVSNSMETFCTEHCGPNKTCPDGFICMPIKNKGQLHNECIPLDFSCYNGL